eukprot:jgi/Ulvmu1/2584/UM014_0035.1
MAGQQQAPGRLWFGQALRLRTLQEGSPGCGMALMMCPQQAAAATLSGGRLPSTASQHGLPSTASQHGLPSTASQHGLPSTAIRNFT